MQITLLTSLRATLAFTHEVRVNNSWSNGRCCEFFEADFLRFLAKDFESVVVEDETGADSRLLP